MASVDYRSSRGMASLWHDVTLEDWFTARKISVASTAIIISNLGIETPDDLSEFDDDEIEELITSNKLDNKLQNKRLRKAYREMKYGEAPNSATKSRIPSVQPEPLLTTSVETKDSNDNGSSSETKSTQDNKTIKQTPDQDQATANTAKETKQDAVLDSNERQTLMAHMSTLKEQESTTQTDRFNEAMKLTFGSAKDALNFGEYLGISSEYERLIVNEGEETMRKEMESLSQRGRQDGDPQWWFSSENEIMKRKFFLYCSRCSNVFSSVYRISCY